MSEQTKKLRYRNVGYLGCCGGTIYVPTDNMYALDKSSISFSAPVTMVPVNEEMKSLLESLDKNTYSYAILDKEYAVVFKGKKRKVNTLPCMDTQQPQTSQQVAM